MHLLDFTEYFAEPFIFGKHMFFVIVAEVISIMAKNYIKI